MASLSTSYDDLATKLVVDTDSNSSEADNATNASGSAFIIQIDATAGLPTTDEPACYVKFADIANATGGGNSSTVPTLTLYAPIGQVTSYVISGGWAFANGLSFWSVTNAALTADVSPTSKVKVFIIST
tara:strand:- start:331 stop:717 length:387 start_codon:yes stop_codon:yes gene_type:complete